MSSCNDGLRQVGPQPGPARSRFPGTSGSPVVPLADVCLLPGSWTTCVTIPRMNWESCAAGGGRIDLGVIERAQRFWTSDMTDALARQHIQRWTAQLVAPEYLGAHASVPRGPPDRSRLPARLPRCHRVLRRLRSRVGPERRMGDGAGSADRVELISTSASDRSSTRAAWSNPVPGTRPSCCMESCPPRQPKRSWRTCSSIESASNRGVVVPRARAGRRGGRTTVTWVGRHSGEAAMSQSSLYLRRPTGGQHVRGEVLASAATGSPVGSRRR